MVISSHAHRLERGGSPRTSNLHTSLLLHDLVQSAICVPHETYGVPVPKKSKVLSLAVLAAIGAVVTGVALGALAFFNVFGTTTIDRTGPSVLVSLQDLNEYRAASAYYETVVDIEKDVNNIPDFVAGQRVLYVGKGDVDAVIDFSGLDEKSITVSEDRLAVEIVLPAPVAGEPVLDLENSYVADYDSGLVNKFKNSSLERDAQLKAVEKMTEAAADEETLMARARENTISMLEGLLGALGFTDVSITFDDGI